MIIYGRNPIIESLKANRLTSLFCLARSSNDLIVRQARESNVPVKFLQHEEELTRMAKNPSHQGFVALVKDYEAASLDDILKISQGQTYPLIVMLDGIEDPHNLGAILRTADAFGVAGIIMKSRGEVPLNSTVAKVSTGAINWVKVAVVTNLNQTIEILKKKGFWVVSADGAGKDDYDAIDYKCPILLIIGSEGFGISSLVKKNSDFIVKIPMTGHVNSLNASVSTAILVAEIVSSRR